MASTNRPARLSPLHHLHLLRGATLVDEAGWQRPESYVGVEQETQTLRTAVGLVDMTPLGKIAARGDRTEALLEAAWPGLSLPPLHVATPNEGTRVCRLAADEALALVPAERQRELRERLERAAAGVGGCVHVIDLTSGYAGVLIAGPRARELLRRCTALDLRDAQLPDHRCAQTALARVQALVARDDLGRLPAYWCFVSRDYAQFVWDWLLEAGHDLDVAPVGLAALRALEAAAVPIGGTPA